jgi:Holliday junction DNA helicase RuvA
MNGARRGVSGEAASGPPRGPRARGGLGNAWVLDAEEGKPVSLVEFVRGRLVERGPDTAVVAVGGFGVRVQVPAGTAEALPEPGAEVTLLTHLILREDAIALYGFATREERTLFSQLLTVAGVGPKVALDVLSSAPVERLAAIIDGGDVEALARVRGIGRKTASRIVLDLKGKLVLPAGAPQPVATGRADGVYGVAAAALRELGFAPQEVAAAVAALPRDRDLTEDEAITLALRAAGSRG